jgi:hypothetical protein
VEEGRRDYHACVPGEEAVDENGDVKESRAAVAQLANICLLALHFEALEGSDFDKVLVIVEAELQKWSGPYKEAEEHLGCCGHGLFTIDTIVAGIDWVCMS